MIQRINCLRTIIMMIQWRRLSIPIGNANELFPSFKVSAPLILGIIIFYMILIIPVLYFILKRKDKREYTWWIIPAIAVVTSIAIFAYGAKDRIGRAQIQHTAMLNVAQDGSLTGYYAESLLTNKSGNFHIYSTSRRLRYLHQCVDDNHIRFFVIPAHKRTMLEKDAAGSTVTSSRCRLLGCCDIYGQTTSGEDWELYDIS